jgi:hypothetical protein
MMYPHLILDSHANATAAAEDRDLADDGLGDRADQLDRKDR